MRRAALSKSKVPTDATPRDPFLGRQAAATPEAGNLNAGSSNSGSGNSGGAISTGGQANADFARARQGTLQAAAQAARGAGPQSPSNAQAAGEQPSAVGSPWPVASTAGAV